MTGGRPRPAWRRAISAARAWARGLLPVRPRSYWTQRHDALAGSLKAPGHADLSEEENQRDYATKRAKLEEALRPFAPAPGQVRRLLDAGCGTGLLFPTWKALGFDVTGLDFASREARSGVGPLGVPVRLGDVCDIPPGDDWDVVACVDVLFHVLDDARFESFLRTAAGAIARGGRVLVQEQLRDDAAYEGVVAHCHFRRLSDYERGAERAGLLIESRSRYVLPSQRADVDVLVLRRA